MGSSDKEQVRQVPKQRSGRLVIMPVANGIDYLVSVVDHLTGDTVTARDLKYGILHLHAAAEVLLKCRLTREHWSLVYEQPGKANKAAHRDVNFKSCTVKEAIERLRNIVGVKVSNPQEEALDSLARHRNALQHYGLKASRAEVESCAGKVLDFLVDFLENELVPLFRKDLPERLARDLTHVRQGMGKIRLFVEQRLSRIEPRLAMVKDRIVTCPNCDQSAMITPKPGTTQPYVCHFCDTRMTPLEYDVSVFDDWSEIELSDEEWERERRLMDEGDDDEYRRRLEEEQAHNDQ